MHPVETILKVLIFSHVSNMGSDALLDFVLEDKTKTLSTELSPQIIVLFVYFLF